MRENKKTEIKQDPFNTHKYVFGTSKDNGSQKRKNKSKNYQVNETLINDVNSFCYNNFNDCQVLSEEEQLKLFKKYKEEGDLMARDALIRGNTKLVIRIARRWQKNNVPLIDLIQEGQIGLMRAIDGFDYTKGYKFSTYAIHWIVESVTMSYYSNTSKLSMSVPKNREIAKQKSAENEFKEKYGRIPTIEELSNYSGLSVRRVKGNNMYANIEMVSLDSDFGFDTNGKHFDEVVADPKNNFENIEKENSINFALKKMEELSERERNIILWHYGLKGYPAMSLDEIGKKLNLSTERIRQIEKKALLKLREKME